MTKTELEDMRKVVKLALLKLGIRCDLAGFGYICYGVELVVLNPNLIHSLCKDLYVSISKHFKTKSTCCVERNIRHAIDKAFCNGCKTLNDMFGVTLFEKNEKPKSGELINLMYEYYTLGLYKSDKVEKNAI